MSEKERLALLDGIESALSMASQRARELCNCEYQVFSCVVERDQLRQRVAQLESQLRMAVDGLQRISSAKMGDTPCDDARETLAQISKPNEI